MLHRNSLCRQLNRECAPHENFDYPINSGRVLSDLTGNHGGPPLDHKLDQNRTRTDVLFFSFRSPLMAKPMPECVAMICFAAGSGGAGEDR
jgi:hypothetical protein